MITNLPVNGDEAASSEPLGEYALLIDHNLPRFDVALLAHEIAEADRVTTWRALRELDLLGLRNPLASALLAAPALPGRAAGPERQMTRQVSPQRLTLDEGLPGWVWLGKAPQQELCLGAVGVFWDGRIRWKDITPAEFARFGDPGYGKVAVSLSVQPFGSRRTLVNYECRIAITDEPSRERFRESWASIRPVVADLMRSTVSAVAQDAAERQHSGAPQPSRN